MAKFYGDENFPQPALEILSKLGHDVVSMRDEGKINQQIPDDEVLNWATASERIVLTLNRKDFIKLHNSGVAHAGIIVCTADDNFEPLAGRIDALLQSEPEMQGKLGRVNRPS